MRQSDSPSARVSTVRPSVATASERSAGDGGRWEEEGVGRRINDHYSTRMNSKAVAVLVLHPPPQRNHCTPVTNFKSSRAFYASYLSLFSQSLFSSTPENPLFGEEKSASPSLCSSSYTFMTPSRTASLRWLNYTASITSAFSQKRRDGFGKSA